MLPILVWILKIMLFHQLIQAHQLQQTEIIRAKVMKMNQVSQRLGVLRTFKNEKSDKFQPLNLLDQHKPSLHQSSDLQHQSETSSKGPSWGQSKNSSNINNNPGRQEFKKSDNSIHDVLQFISKSSNSLKQKQERLSPSSTSLQDSENIFGEKSRLLLGSDNWYLNNPWENQNTFQETYNQPNFNDGNFGFGGKEEGNQNEQKKEEQKFQEEDFEYIHHINNQPIEKDKVINIEPIIANNKLQQLKLEGQIFNDRDFSPTHQSLGKINGLATEISWDRISERMPESDIFVDRVNPQDIIQGQLNDCYLLAAIAALAERPDIIWNLFILHQKNQQKFFSMKMLYRGKWRIIDVDDWVPFSGNKLVFGRSRQQQLWVTLLQKAWAKIYGSYNQIVYGFPEEALHDLTGAPIKIVFPDHPKFEDPWEYLLEASANKYPMVASSNQGPNSQQSYFGIVLGHAYTVMNVNILKNGFRQEKIVQLRNPWGDRQYRGKWSDMDPAWHYIQEEERNRIGYKKDRHDGIFYMPYEEFKKEISFLTVAEINENASYVYQSYWDPEQKGVYFVIEVIKSGRYSLQVDKTPQRAFKDFLKGQTYQYPESQLQLAKISDQRVIRFQGIINRRRTLYKSYDMTPGIYVAFVKIRGYNKMDQNREVNLAIYSEIACKIGLASHQQASRFAGDPNVSWNYDSVKQINGIHQVGSGQVQTKYAFVENDAQAQLSKRTGQFKKHLANEKMTDDQILAPRKMERK